MEKYERLLKQTTKPRFCNEEEDTSQEVVQHGGGYESDTEDTSLGSDLILSALPKPYRQRGSALLRHIQNDPDHRLSWDRKGQLIYQGGDNPR